MLVPAAMVILTIGLAIAIKRGGSKSNSGARTIATTNAYSESSRDTDAFDCDASDDT